MDGTGAGRNATKTAPYCAALPPGTLFLYVDRSFLHGQSAGWSAVTATRERAISVNGNPKTLFTAEEKYNDLEFQLPLPPPSKSAPIKDTQIECDKRLAHITGGVFGRLEVDPRAGECTPHNLCYWSQKQPGEKVNPTSDSYHTFKGGVSFGRIELDHRSGECNPPSMVVLVAKATWRKGQCRSNGGNP